MAEAPGSPEASAAKRPNKENAAAVAVPASKGAGPSLSKSAALHAAGQQGAKRKKAGGAKPGADRRWGGVCPVPRGARSVIDMHTARAPAKSTLRRQPVSACTRGTRSGCVPISGARMHTGASRTRARAVHDADPAADTGGAHEDPSMAHNTNGSRSSGGRGEGAESNTSARAASGNSDQRALRAHRPRPRPLRWRPKRAAWWRPSSRPRSARSARSAPATRSRRPSWTRPPRT
jgi:hypothetical protein